MRYWLCISKSAGQNLRIKIFVSKKSANMKKFLLILVLIISGKLFAQTNATRILPVTYVKGGTVSVKININVSEGVTGVIVKEWLPQDLVVSETMVQSTYPVILKHEVDPDNAGYNIYSWVAFGSSIPSFSITYRIQMPQSASGDYIFYGKILTLDNPQGEEIQGDSILHGNIGDIDGNGNVDISDVILCLRMAINLDTPEPDKADVNKDSVVDISDVIIILRISIGLI